MQDIFIEETDTTPQINLLFSKGKLTLKGVSYPEYAKEFYQPVLEAIREYVSTDPQKHTEMAFKFTYFNTGTNPLITGIMKELENLSNIEGKTVEVNWYYEKDDDDMKEVGEYLETLTELEIRFIPVDSIE